MPKRYKLTDPNGTFYQAPGGYFTLRGNEVVEVPDDAPQGVLDDIKKKLGADVLTLTLDPPQKNTMPRRPPMASTVPKIDPGWKRRGHLARPTGTTGEAGTPPGPITAQGRNAGPNVVVVGPNFGPTAALNAQDPSIAVSLAAAGTGVVEGGQHNDVAPEAAGSPEPSFPWQAPGTSGVVTAPSGGATSPNPGTASAQAATDTSAAEPSRPSEGSGTAQPGDSNTSGDGIALTDADRGGATPGTGAAPPAAGTPRVANRGTGTARGGSGSTSTP